MKLLLKEIVSVDENNFYISITCHVPCTCFTNTWDEFSSLKTCIFVRTLSTATRAEHFRMGYPYNHDPENRYICKDLVYSN